MKRIHILSRGWTNPNSSAFLFPLFAFKNELRDAGSVIRIYYDLQDNLPDCEFLFLESKFFGDLWVKDRPKVLEKIETLSQKTKLIWCDQSDSSGTLLGDVIPFVHRYLKAQVLKDTDWYTKPHHSARPYTEHYHLKNGITDEEPFSEPLVQNPQDLSKIGLSWNSGLMHHGFMGPHLNRLLHTLPLPFLAQYPAKISTAQSPRFLNVACRMGISYNRATVRYQRERLREILKNHVLTNKISRRQYFKELQNSKICLSPFGFGEITLKDFEVFLTGSCLLKPDMDHMSTWPNFYEKDVTYAAHGWDLDDVESIIENLLADDKKRINIAQTAQNRFIQYTSGKDASALFVEHFRSLVA